MLRCKEDHPTMQKYAKLAELAEKLGISLYFCAGKCIVNDRDRDDKLPILYLEDIEGDFVCSFPHDFEYKMIYDNPVTLEEQQRELIERTRQCEAEKARKIEETTAKQATEEKHRIEELERKEKDLLADLKRKYES